MKKKLVTRLLLLSFISALAAFFVVPAVQAVPLTCNMQSFSGEDDTAHQMNLPFSLYLGDTDYNTIYLTTNGTMTFGQPDANYWSFPSTPSVSLAGWDWVTWGDGAYVSYGYTESSFCIEWSVRPYPQSTGDLTQIRLVVQKYSDGSWHGEIVTFGWLPENNRRGIVATYNGDPILIEAAFDVNGGTPVEVTPAPVPTDFNAPVPTYCWDGSTVYEPDVCPIEPTPTPSPTETIPDPTPSPTETIPDPTPSPTEVSPSPTPTETTPSPTPEPTQSVYPSPSSSPSESQLQPVEPPVTQTPTPEPTTSSPEPVTLIETQSPSPDSSLLTILPQINDSTDLKVNYVLEQLAPGEAVSSELMIELGLDYEDLPPDTPVELENGVILTAKVADALELFENPNEILLAVFTDPTKVLTAVANIGEDMTPQKREESQKVVIAAVIAGQLMNGISVINNTGRKI